MARDMEGEAEDMEAESDGKNETDTERLKNKRKKLAHDCREIEHLIAAQQTALEILTNLCCLGEGEDEEWEDEEDDEQSDDVSVLLVL